MPRDEEDLDPDDGDGDPGDPPEENPLTNQARPTRGPDRMKRRPPRNIGTTPDPDKFIKTAGADADLVWNEINAWLPSVHLQPQDVLISFKRMVPPSAQATAVPVGRAFSGNVVAGSQTETPGSALVQYAIQYLHIPSTPRGVAATYEVYFTYAGGATHQGRSRANGMITQAPLSLPSVQEIMDAQHAVEFAERQQAGVGGGPPPGYQPRSMPGAGAGPGMNPQPPQQQYFAPPQAQPQGMPAEMWGLMDRVMNEAFAAAREGRQPRMPEGTAGPPAAMSQTELEDRVTGKVLMGVQAMLTRAGVIPQPGAIPTAPAVAAAPIAPPAAPAAPAENSLEGMIKQGINGILATVVKTTMSSVEGSVRSAMGVGGVPEAEEPPEVPAPPKPEDDLPFTVAPVGAAWADGRPMQVATSKEEDKGIDWMGTMMANPVIAEKAMDLANGLGNAFKEFLQSRTPGASPAAQVVKQIPAGAVRADVAAPPPPPNGSGGEGWGQAP